MSRERMAGILFFTLVALVSVGCVRLQIRPLPAYDAAMALPGPHKPKIFSDDTKISAALTPYLIIEATSGDAADRNSIIIQIGQKAAEYRADVVIIKDGGRQYAGSVATGVPLGYGVSSAVSTPMYQRAILGLCYRLNPSSLGFTADQNNMIVAIQNNAVFESGIIEGDTVVSINDFAYSAAAPELLNLRPSQDVKVIIIRPGAGRLVKMIQTIKNEATYLNYSDAVRFDVVDVGSGGRSGIRKRVSEK